MENKKVIFIIAAALILIIGGFFVYNSFVKEQSFTKTSLLKLNLPVGGEVSNKVKIYNYNDGTHDFKISLSNLKGMASLEESEFSLEKGDTKELIIFFKDVLNEPGVYLGKLVIESDVSTEEVPIILGVEDPNHAFAIIESRISQYENLYPGGKLGLEIKVYDLLGANVEAVQANYVIKNFDDEELMMGNENLAVGGGGKTELFDIPLNWQKDDYVFITSIDYKGTKSISSYLFTISDKTKTAFFLDFKVLVIIISLVFLGILVLILYFIKTRDELIMHLKKQQGEELKRNVEYIKRSKKEIEKSKISPQKKQKKLKMFGIARRNALRKLKQKQKSQRKEINKLKKAKKKPLIERKLEQWKKEGYQMYETDKEVKKITKKGINEHVNDWKKKGYDVDFLKK